MIDTLFGYPVILTDEMPDYEIAVASIVSEKFRIRVEPHPVHEGQLVARLVDGGLRVVSAAVVRDILTA